MYFDKEIEYLKNVESQKDFSSREILTEEQVRKIKEKYPNISFDYLDYLQSIGAGSIKDSSFNIYSDLTDFYDLGLNDIYDVDDNIKFFGDNFAGDFVGFDLIDDNDEVVEFWHDDDKIFRTGKTFKEYIIDKIYNG